MRLRAAFRCCWAGLIGLLALGPAVAGPPATPASLPQSPEVMLYASVRVGAGARGGGFKLPNLSLRLGQARMGGNSWSPTGGDPMQHRELLRLDLAGRQSGSPLDMRLGLGGGRVTYDINRGIFGLHPDGWQRPSITTVATSGPIGPQFQTKPLMPRLWEPSAFKHNPVTSAGQLSAGVRDVAAPSDSRR
jgi:hypothetical protein